MLVVCTGSLKCTVKVDTLHALITAINELLAHILLRVERRVMTRCVVYVLRGSSGGLRNHLLMRTLYIEHRTATSTLRVSLADVVVRLNESSSWGHIIRLDRTAVIKSRKQRSHNKLRVPLINYTYMQHVGANPMRHI